MFLHLKERCEYFIQMSMKIKSGMAKNLCIRYLVYSILFLLIYLIALYIIYLIAPYITYFMHLNNEDQSGFLGTFIGGMSAGIFAIYGVILTLDYQRFKQESEIGSHKKMLLTQLKFTCHFITKLPSKGNDSLYGGKLVYDPDWHKHLQYIDLDETDLKTVVDWFDLMHKIEIEANKTFGGRIAADYIIKKFDIDEQLSKINKIVEKL